MAKSQIALCILLVACVHDSDSSLLSGLTSMVSSSTTTNAATSLLSSITDTTSSIVSTTGISSALSDITSVVSSVTSSSASNPLLSLFTSGSTTFIDTMANQIKNIVAMMASGFKSAMVTIASFETVVNATISSSIGELDTLINSYSDTDVDMSSCIALTSGIQTIAAKAIIDTSTCSSKYVTTLQSEFDALITAFENCLNELYAIAKQIESNSGNILTFFTNLETLNSEIAAATADCSSLIPNATSFITEMANMGTTLKNCGFEAAVTKVESNVLTYTIEFTTCMAELTASGTGLSSAVDAASSVAGDVVSSLTG